MKPNELVDIINTLEGTNKEITSYEALTQLGYYDEKDDILFSRTTGEPYNNSFIARNIYNEEEIALINSWAELLGEDNFSFSPFCERTFLRNFLASVPQHEHMHYIRNTNMHYGKNSSQADPKFVLVTRRSLPSKEDKTEMFWSEEPTTTFWGLRTEISGEQRAYSAIMVSTLSNLQEHGKQDIELLSSGASDGEIITSSRPFPSSKVLFAYKPLDEVSPLLQTIRTTNRTYDEFLNEVKNIMSSRYAEANPIQSPPNTLDGNSSNTDFDFSMDDWL